MRLYLYAQSKNGIGYTPDTLTIEAEGKEYEYDILGSVDFDDKGLNCEVKGDLEIRDNETDEFREMTEEEEKQLLWLLSGFTKDKTIKIYVYPAHEENSQEWVDSVNNDELTEANAELQFSKEGISVEFGFTPVFVEF